MRLGSNPNSSRLDGTEPNPYGDDMRCPRCKEKECPLASYYHQREAERSVPTMNDTYVNVVFVVALLVLVTYMVGGFE